MTQEVNIREATLADVDAIAELGRTTYREHFSDLWYDMDEFLAEDFTCEAIESCLNSREKHRYLLAENNGGLLGFAKVNMTSVETGDETTVMELQKLYVRKAYIGQKIGSALLAQVVCLAEQTGRDRIRLDVLRSNTAAQQFYQRHQFRVAQTLPYDTDKCGIGLYMMERWL